MNPTLRNIKELFKYILQPVMVPIQSGPLKGKKWVISTGSKFIKGTYEPFKTNPFLENLHEGDVVYDVGAHVGYYTGIASITVGQRGQVYSFEPRPINISFLKRHIRVNKFTNVRLIESSVGDRPGESRFETRTGTGTGHVSAKGNILVRMVCLDDLYGKGELPKPNLVKIDVEGGEVGVLEGARRIIEEARPVILVATHGKHAHEFVTKFLESFNYRYRILDQEGAKGDIEILAIPG